MDPTSEAADSSALIDRIERVPRAVARGSFTSLEPRRREKFRASAQSIHEFGVAELLAILVGELGDRLAERVARGELWQLSHASPLELAREFELAPRAATRLAAALALARRMISESRATRIPLRSPAQVFRLMEPDLRGLERESFHVLALDGKHRLQRRELVSVGTLTMSLVHPREVFRPAVRIGAAALIAVHNHPSGDPEPSLEDFEVTRRLLQVGRVIGIPMLDHVVIGESRYVSLAERLGLSREPSQT